MAAKFTFGGLKRELRIELKDAPRFEEATGLGIMSLIRAMVDAKSATSSQVVEVLRTAFAVNGTHYSTDEIYAMIQEDANGLINAYACAGIVVMELVLRPEGANKGKKPEPAKSRGRPNASH